MENESEEVVSLYDDQGQPVTQADDPEVEAAPVVEEAPAFEVPEKFQGKSMEDVIQSYVNLEKEYGNKANEVGELRKLTDQILMNQLQTPQQQHVEEQQIEEVGFDDLIDDPMGAVNRAVNNNPTLKAVEQKLVEDAQAKARDALMKAHSDADDVTASPEFNRWLSEDTDRMVTLANAAKSNKAGPAIDLITAFKATRQATNEQAIDERNAKAEADLKKAAVETGGTGQKSKKKYKRSELIHMKIHDPAQYQARYDEFMQAYAEKRVI